MAHVRKQIRDAVVTAVTGLTTTGNNVSASRVYPVEQSKLPHILVYTTDEAISLEGGTLDAPMRGLTVRISGIAEDNSTLDDTLDQIAAEVEAAIGADVTQGGLSISTDLSETSIELQGESEKKVGIINLDYLIQYRTPFGDPETVA